MGNDTKPKPIGKRWKYYFHHHQLCFVNHFLFIRFPSLCPCFSSNVCRAVSLPICVCVFFGRSILLEAFGSSAGYIFCHPFSYTQSLFVSKKKTNQTIRTGLPNMVYACAWMRTQSCMCACERMSELVFVRLVTKLGLKLPFDIVSHIGNLWMYVCAHVCVCVCIRLCHAYDT